MEWVEEDLIKAFSIPLRIETCYSFLEFLMGGSVSGGEHESLGYT